MSNFSERVHKVIGGHKTKRKQHLVAAVLSGITAVAVSASLIFPAISATKAGDSSATIPDVQMLLGKPVLESLGYTDSSKYDSLTYSQVANKMNAKYALGVASQFSVFLNGKFTSNEADCEGRMAASGGIDVSGYPYGTDNGDGYRIACGHFINENTSDYSAMETLYGSNFAHAIFGGSVNTDKLAYKPATVSGDEGYRKFVVESGFEYNDPWKWYMWHKTSDVLDFSKAFETLTTRSTAIAATADNTKNNPIYDDQGKDIRNTVTVDDSTHTVTFKYNEGQTEATSVMFNLTKDQLATISNWKMNDYGEVNFNFVNIPLCPESDRIKNGFEYLVDENGNQKKYDATWDPAYIIINVESNNGTVTLPDANIVTSVTTQDGTQHIITNGKIDPAVEANKNAASIDLFPGQWFQWTSGNKGTETVTFNVPTEGDYVLQVDYEGKQGGWFAIKDENNTVISGLDEGDWNSGHSNWNYGSKTSNTIHLTAGQHKFYFYGENESKYASATLTTPGALKNFNNKIGCSSILYNFADATKVTLAQDFQGTILAPNAEVGDNGRRGGGSAGHLSGALIATKFSGSTEFGYRPYLGNYSVIPVPASAKYEANFQKVDQNGAGLDDAKINLYKNGSILNQFTTQAGGNLLSGLIPGKYYFQEAKAPAGFQLNDEPTGFFELIEAEKISTDDGGVEEDSSSSSSSSTDTSSSSSGTATTITVNGWESGYSGKWENSSTISFNASAAGTYELTVGYQAKPGSDGGGHQFQVKVNNNAMYVNGNDYWDEDVGWNTTYKTFTVNLNAGNNTISYGGKDCKFVSAVFTPTGTSKSRAITTNTTTQEVYATNCYNNGTLKTFDGSTSVVVDNDFINVNGGGNYKVGIPFTVDDTSDTTTYKIDIYAQGQTSPMAAVRKNDSSGTVLQVNGSNVEQYLSEGNWNALRTTPTSFTVKGSEFGSTGTYYGAISCNSGGYINLYKVVVTKTTQTEESSSQVESSSQSSSSSQADSSSQIDTGDLTIKISQKADGTYEYVPYIEVNTYGSLTDLNNSSNATGTHKYYLYDINNAAYEINGTRYTAARILNGNAGSDIKYRKLANNQYMFFGSDGTPLEPIVNISTVSSGIGTIQLENNPAELENAIFSVKKVDSVNQSTVLAGAEFKLYIGENSSGTCLATLTTDSNGAITASAVQTALKAVQSSYSDYIDDAGCLKPAYVSGSSESGDLVLGDQKYCLVETVAPNGYQGTHLYTAIVFTVHPTQDSSTKKWTSTVQSSGVSDWCTFNSSTFEFTVLNDKVPSADFKLKKVGDDGYTTLSGAKFVLKATDGTVLKTWDPFDGNEVLISTVTDTTKSTYVDADGKLKEGNYILTEESAPTGYNKLSGDITIAVDSNGNITITPNSNDSSLVNVSSDTIKVVTVTNKLKSGRIKVAKKWLDSNGNTIMGSDGTVKDLDGNPVENLTVTIKRKVGSTVDDSFSRTVTLSNKKYDATEQTWFDYSEDLPLTNENGDTYIYFVEENFPSGNFNGYSTTYSYSDGNNSNAEGIALIAGKSAKVEVTIINKEPVKVTLPETGGMGRTIPYIIGALIAMLSATTLVIKQRRSNSN